MKKAVLCVAMLAAMVAFSLSLMAADSMTWTGWISDSKCGAAGMKAEHKGCSLSCVKRGEKYVFVNSETKQVFAIHNQDAVSESNLGMEVKLTGQVMDDKSIHVESIAAASKM
ncbi:MAG TPA: hypothetical protein VKM93_15195 [Terriglobia bacterium]|nr:hypothetical protein [Terriglobia bacterium]